jgi:hypothetical protein
MHTTHNQFTEEAKPWSRSSCQNAISSEQHNTMNVSIESRGCLRTRLPSLPSLLGRPETEGNTMGLASNCNITSSSAPSFFTSGTMKVSDQLTNYHHHQQSQPQQQQHYDGRELNTSQINISNHSTHTSSIRISELLSSPSPLNSSRPYTDSTPFSPISLNQVGQQDDAAVLTESPIALSSQHNFPSIHNDQHQHQHHHHNHTISTTEEVGRMTSGRSTPPQSTRRHSAQQAYHCISSTSPMPLTSSPPSSSYVNTYSYKKRSLPYPILPDHRLHTVSHGAIFPPITDSQFVHLPHVSGRPAESKSPHSKGKHIS